MYGGVVKDDILISDLVLHGSFGATLSPERALLEAILFRTQDDLVKYPITSLIYQHALTWVIVESYEPHGFGWVCAFLGLDPQATARAMVLGQGLYNRERIRFSRMTPVKQRVRERRQAEGAYG